MYRGHAVWAALGPATLNRPLALVKSTTPNGGPSVTRIHPHAQLPSLDRLTRERFSSDWWQRRLDEEHQPPQPDPDAVTSDRRNELGR